MKTTLVFDPYEDQEELYNAMNGWKYRAVINDIYQYLRSQDKIGKDSVDIQKLRVYIAQQLNERSVEV